MKKLLSSILVCLLVIGGILYLPECSDSQMEVEGKIITVIDDGDSRSSRSGNIYYVTTLGDNSKSGLTEANAWQTIKYAATKATAGDTVYVKKGNYGNEEVVITNSGTNGNPIIFEGYKTTPGDHPDVAYRPVLDHTDGTGIAFEMDGKDYITIKYFYITNYSTALRIYRSDYTTIDYIYGIEFGTLHPNWDYAVRIYDSHHGTMSNCYIKNTLNGVNYILWCSDYWLIDNCESRSDLEGPGGGSWQDSTDYYFRNYFSSYNTYQNCLAYNEHAAKGGHHGHGFCIKDSIGLSSISPQSHHNKFINCESIDMQESFTLVGLVHDNEFINCTQSTDDNTDWAVFIFDGAYNNTFTGCEFNDVIFSFAYFRDYTGGYPPHDNTFENCLFKNGGTGGPSGGPAGAYRVHGMIHHQDGSYDNNFQNCVFDTAGALYGFGGNNSANYIRNSIMVNITDLAENDDGATGSVSINYSSFNNNKYSKPSGTGNIATDPKFASPSNYQLKSKFGRWNGATWVYDKETSPCIDAGDPYDIYNSESKPNGGRINIGMYGNTSYASKSSSLPPIIETTDVTSAIEDDEYKIIYTVSNINLALVTWKYSSNASWLNWGAINHTLYGTPTNADVGSYWVRINITDGKGSYDEHNFSLSVVNVNDPPIITTTSLLTCLTNELYWCDYDAMDIDPTNDELYWVLRTNTSFLLIDSITGNLSGTPINKNIGTYWVNISVKDNQGGNDFDNFTLMVKNLNNPPIIIPQTDFAFEEDTINTSLNVTNWFQDIDDDPLKYSCIGNKKIDVVIQKTGTVELIPESNWSGTETLTFITNDTRSSVEDAINVTVIPVNDIPFNAIIETNNTKLYVGHNFTASGNAFDVDIPYGDQLNFYWYVNNSQTYFAEGKKVNTPLFLDNEYLTPGNYSIMLDVKDSELAMCFSIIQIEIIATLDDPIDTQPEIISTNPVNNAIDVRVNSSIIINFNEPMNKKSVENVIEIVPYTGFYFKWDITNKISEMCFNNNLSYNTYYKITIGIARDIASNQLINAPFVLSFKTEKIIITESSSISLTIISPSDHSEVRPNERITITGSSVGLNEGTQVYVNLADRYAIGRIDSNGLWSVTMRAPRVVGNYKIEVIAENQTQSLDIDTLKQKEQNPKKPKDDFNIKESYVGIYILIFIIILSIIIITLFIKKKRSKEIENRPELRKNEELKENKKPSAEKRSKVSKPLPVKKPRKKSFEKSSNKNDSPKTKSKLSEKDKLEKEQNTESEKSEPGEQRIIENDPLNEDIDAEDGNTDDGIDEEGIDVPFDEEDEYLKNEFEDVVAIDGFLLNKFQEEIDIEDELVVDFEDIDLLDEDLLLEKELNLEIEGEELVR